MYPHHYDEGILRYETEEVWEVECENYELPTIVKQRGYAKVTDGGLFDDVES